MNHALIIGCGIVGAVIARELADNGVYVDLWERRNHIGGNMYDYVDDHGILVHKYGPHCFHTGKKTLIDYISRFAKWIDYELQCGAEINGICTPSPFNFKTIDDFYDKKKAAEIKKHIAGIYGNRETATVLELLNCSDRLVREYAEFLFESDYSLYTAKQWGIAPDKIDPSVLKRVPIRFNYREAYFDDEYQVMPAESYTEFFVSLLKHDRIKLQLNIDALSNIEIRGENIYINGRLADYPVIYTGAIDELFGKQYGALPYRSLRFEWYHENKDRLQKYPVVAYPQADGYTRIVEFKMLPKQIVSGTTYEVEYPLPYTKENSAEPFYPVLTKESKKLYEKYLQKSRTVNNLVLCGRLADFKYYNMDQALERALEISRYIIERF